MVAVVAASYSLTYLGGRIDSFHATENLLSVL